MVSGRISRDGGVKFRCECGLFFKRIGFEIEPCGGVFKADPDVYQEKRGDNCFFIHPNCGKAEKLYGPAQDYWDYVHRPNGFKVITVVKTKQS